MAAVATSIPSAADLSFSLGRYHLAAQQYASQTSPVASLEEVVLKFVDVDEKDALRFYLGARFEQTAKTEKTQRLMLATWLVEMNLSKLNSLEDVVASMVNSPDVESLQLERSMVEEELRQFLSDCVDDLDRQTTYDLFLSHGRADLYIDFALKIKDYERVVEYWVLEENWDEAISVLNRQSDPELYHRFSSVLMHNAPEKTVDSWIRFPTLQPRRLIPALLQQHSHLLGSPSTSSGGSSSARHATRYLQHVIYNQSDSDPMIHNLLITLYTSSTSSTEDRPLLDFLSSSPHDPHTDRPYYDLDFALRLCHSRPQACLLIYDRMGLYESAVDLALETGDVEGAKASADKVRDDEALKKALWLKIAKHVVQEKKDIKTAMKLLESSNFAIEDILSFFPDFVVIDDVKQEICAALESCAAQIQSLKSEMDETTRNAELIKQEVKDLEKRFVLVNTDDRCDRCGRDLMGGPFYVFPCGHKFRADCLITLLKQYAPAQTLRRILHLQQALVRSSSSQPAAQAASSNAARNALLSTTPPSSTSNGRNTFAMVGDRLSALILPEALASAIGPTHNGGKKKDVPSTLSEVKLEKMRKELDEMLARSCVLCDMTVSQLETPFVKAGEEEEGGWTI